MKTTVISARIDPHRKKLLKLIAAMEGKPLYQVLNDMIDLYAQMHRETMEILTHPDWMERIRESEKKFEEGKTISHEELARKLKLED